MDQQDSDRWICLDLAGRTHVEGGQLSVAHPLKFPDQLDGFFTEHPAKHEHTQDNLTKLFPQRQRLGLPGQLTLVWRQIPASCWDHVRTGAVRGQTPSGAVGLGSLDTFI